jgi:hypothetical protein
MSVLMSQLWRSLLGVWVSFTWAVPICAAEEIEQLLDRLLAVPTIQTEAGFTATVLIPPGALYDSFDLHSSGTALWISDDGKEKGEKGGRILTVDASGSVSVIADVDALLPPVSLDVAPPSFGAWSGHIYTVAFARPDAEAGFFLQTLSCKAAEAGSWYEELNTRKEKPSQTCHACGR